MTSARPGIRFSLMDAVVLLAGAGVATVASRYSREFAILAATVVVHFFLFCNVFRIARLPELVWASLFVACVAAQALLELPWLPVAGVIAFATVSIVWREMRQPTYHGVFWSRVRPRAR